MVLDNALFSALAPPGTKLSQEKFNWNNAWTYRIGAQFFATEALTFRAGFVYDETPIPDNTFSPRLPGNDRLLYSFGAGYKLGKWAFDLTYVYWDLKEREKTATSSITGQNVATVAGATAVTIDAPAAGQYQADAHFVAFQVSYSF